MARKIALRTVPLTLNGANGSASDSVNAVLSYGDMMQSMLRYAPQGTGLVLDDVLKAVDAIRPLEKAMSTNADSVTFSEDQWKTLREKLEGFRFTLADPAIAEFGLAIRDAKEITGGGS